MKRTGTLALIAVAIAYLLGLQVVRYERAVAREGSTIATAPRPAPANPPTHGASPARRVEFGGYPCHDDKCSDDWAGYRWAQANRIADPDDCTGRTGAFIEGCRVYARQQTQGSRSG